jgi:ankyrin repeat protein
LVKAKSKPGPNPKSKLGPGRSERSGSAEPRHDSHRPRKNHTGLKDLSSPRTGTLFAVNPPGKKRRPLAFHAVNVQDRSGQTPVFRYCDHGDIDAVQQLIDAGADINIKDNGGWTPLHKAAVAGHLELASLLIKYGADVNAASNCLDTPLHDAAENGYVDVVQKLLQSGAYLNARNNKNETAHDVAGDEETTECLKKWEEMVCKVNVADAEGRIPLHLAAASGNVPEIMTQIFYGANIRRKDNGGYSPLHLASLYGHLDAAHHLLRLGSEVASASEESETPLMDAAINGHSKVVGLLLSYGADAQHRSKDGKAPEDECTDEACLELLRRPRDSWKPFVEPEWMLRPFPGSASEVMELREPRVGAEAEDHHAATHKQPNGVGAAHHHGRRGAPGRPRAGSLVSESGSHTSGTGGHGTGSENGRSAKGHHSTLREASQLGWGFAWFDAAKDVAVTREERKLQALMKIIDKQEGKVPGEAGAGPVGKPGESHKAKPHHSDKDSLVESHETKPKKTKEKEKEKAEKRKEKELKRAEKEKEREEKKKRKEKKKERDPNETPKKRGRPPKSAAVSTDVSPNTQLRMEEDEQLEILKRELQQIEEKQRSSREGSYDFDEWGSGSKKKGKGKKPKSASKVKGEPMDGGSALPSSAIKRGPGRPPKSSSPIKKDEDISDDEDEPHGVKREREGRGWCSA